MRRHIETTPQQIKDLIRIFGVSDVFIYACLNYKKNGPASVTIREAALKMGGRYIDPEFVPDCKTEYLEGQIRQTFSAGVVLTIDRKTGKAVITAGDDVVRRTEDPVRMTEWNLLAQEAQQLAVMRSLI